MINIETIENNIWTVINTINANPTIIDKPNAPSPTGVYNTIGVNEVTQVANEFVYDTNASGITKVKGQYNVSVKFSSYRQPTKVDINNLQFHIYNNPVVIDAFLSYGLHVHGTGTRILDIPAVMEGQWEERSEFDVDFLLANIENVDTSFIGQVTVEGDYLDDAGDIVYQSSVTVTD